MLCGGPHQHPSHHWIVVSDVETKEPHWCDHTHINFSFKTYVVTISCRTDLDATIHICTFLSIRIVEPTKETAHVI